MDEDTCATNFMIRDRRMRMYDVKLDGKRGELVDCVDLEYLRLVEDSKEPITPFISRIKSLSEDHGTSSILVCKGLALQYLSI